MKDATRHTLEASRPGLSALKTVKFCLERLYDDTHHSIIDEVVHNLTFEELIGTLLQAYDEVCAAQRREGG